MSSDKDLKYIFEGSMVVLNLIIIYLLFGTSLPQVIKFSIIAAIGAIILPYFIYIRFRRSKIKRTK